MQELRATKRGSTIALTIPGLKSFSPVSTSAYPHRFSDTALEAEQERIAMLMLRLGELVL